MAVEVSVAGNVALTRGWQKFARACGLGQQCTLHFKFDGDATLFVRMFGGCCPEGDDDGCPLILGNGGGEGEVGRALGDARSSSSFGDSPSNGISSSSGRDQPLRRCARFEGGKGIVPPLRPGEA